MSSAPIVHLHLDITNNCNFKCEFCFHYGDLTARRGFMDTALAKRVLDEVAEKKLATEVSTAVFGEALLHPDFFPIAEHAIGHGLGLTLNTKGGALNPENSQRIAEMGVGKVIVSFNTPDEATYKVNHAPGKLTYGEHVDKVRGLIDAKFAAKSDLQIYVYVMNTHFARPRGLKMISDNASAERVINFWRDQCVEVATKHGLKAPPELSELVDPQALVERKWPIDSGLEFLPGVELVLKEAHMWGNRLLDPQLEPVPTTKGFCPFPWMMLTVHWDGDCSLCCLDYNKEAVLGNVNDASLADIFGGEKMMHIRSRMSAGHIDEPICQNCLGGVRDKTTGEVIRRPQSSQTARVLNGVEKYGVYQSVQYGWELLKERVRGLGDS